MLAMKTSLGFLLIPVIIICLAGPVLAVQWKNHSAEEWLAATQNEKIQYCVESIAKEDAIPASQVNREHVKRLVEIMDELLSRPDIPEAEKKEPNALMPAIGMLWMGLQVELAYEKMPDVQFANRYVMDNPTLKKAVGGKITKGPRSISYASKEKGDIAESEITYLVGGPERDVKVNVVVGKNKGVYWVKSASYEDKSGKKEILKGAERAAPK
jgi:hypothetical protein